MNSTVNSTGQAGAVKGRALAEVERDVARVIEELEALKAERDALPAQADEARAGLDSWRLEGLERRGRELAGRIDEGQARLHRLSAERAGLLLPEAEEKARAAKQVYDRAHDEYLRAHRLTNRLGVEYDNAQAQALRLRQSVEEHERKAQELSFRPAARQS